MDAERDDVRNVRCRGCGEQFYEVEIDRAGYCESCAEVHRRVKKWKAKEGKHDAT
jgi:ribosomal protein L37E